MITKPLLLPSSGFAGYPELIDLYPMDIGFILDSKNSFINLSFTEFLYWVVKNYTNIKKPQEVLFFDAVYVYLVLYAFFISSEYETNNNCDSCKKTNDLFLDLSSLDIKYMKKSEDMSKKISHSGIEFDIRPRKIIDSIKSGNIDITLNEEALIDRIFKYIYFQCNEIKFNNEIVNDPDELCDVIRYYGSKNIKNHMNFFDEVKNIDLSFGFITKKYECYFCKKINDTTIFDPFSSAMLHGVSDSDDAFLNEKNDLKNFFLAASQDIITISEIRKVPLNKSDVFFDALNEALKIKTGTTTKDYLSDSSGGL
jgi:hypothetical protein